MDCKPFASRDLRTRALRRLLTLALLALVAVPATASAAATPIPSFGTGGIASLGPAARVLGLATENNGRVIALGSGGESMLVARLGANGLPAAAFPAASGVANAAAIQVDGKIVVAGRVTGASTTPLNGAMVVKRFNTNGTLDRTFGSGGSARAAGAVANSVAIANDGSIVVGGYVAAADGFPRVALARFLPNGKPDTSFGTRGFATVDFGKGSQARGVAVQSDGKIVFAGEQIPGLQAVNALIGRVTKKGALDGTFAAGGVYFYYHPKGGAASSFYGVVIDSAGRIVGGGGDLQDAGPHALFARLSRGGSPDGSFGSGGVITTTSARNYGGGDLVGARGIAIAGGGEIVAAGAFKDSGLTYSALWAITPGGQLDGRVGPAGTVLTPISGVFGGESHAVAVAPAGDLYSGGDTLGFTGHNGGFVARYSGFGALPPRPRAVTVTLSRIARTYKIATIIRSGLSVNVRVRNQGSTVAGSLVVTKTTARRLRLGSRTTLGKVTKRLSRAGTARLRIRLTSAAKRALARQRRSVSVTVQIVTSPKIGAPITTTRRTTFRK